MTDSSENRKKNIEYPSRFFSNFEKGIESMVLKLSVAVHPSLAEILICQLYVSMIFDIAMAT